MAASYGGQVILPPPQHHLSLAGVHPPHEPPAAFLVVRAQEPDDDGEEEQARHRVPHPCLVDHGHPQRLVLVPPREEQRPDRAGAVPAVAVVVFAAAVVARGAVPGDVPLHIGKAAPVRAGQDGAGGGRRGRRGRGRDHVRSARAACSSSVWAPHFFSSAQSTAGALARSRGARGKKQRGRGTEHLRRFDRQPRGGEAHVCAVPRRAGPARNVGNVGEAGGAACTRRRALPLMCGSGPAARGFAGARTGWGALFLLFSSAAPMPGPASRLAFVAVVCTGRFPRGSTRAECST
jgi:hypothetical protein